MKIITKLKSQTGETDHYLLSENIRSVDVDIDTSFYDETLLDQFVFGIDVKDIIKEYYKNLFVNFIIKTEIITKRIPGVELGNIIEIDNKKMSIMEINRNYDLAFHKYICLGEE